MRRKPLTAQAGAALDALVAKGTTMAFLSVRRLHAEGFLPVRVWDDRPPADFSVPILPASTSAEELWAAAIRPHRPAIVRGRVGVL